MHTLLYTFFIIVLNAGFQISGSLFKTFQKNK